MVQPVQKHDPRDETKKKARLLFVVVFSHLFTFFFVLLLFQILDFSCFPSPSPYQPLQILDLDAHGVHNTTLHSRE